MHVRVCFTILARGEQRSMRLLCAHSINQVRYRDALWLSEHALLQLVGKVLGE